MLQTRYYAQWTDLLQSLHTHIGQVPVHYHDYGQASWFAFVVANLSTPVSLLDLEHAFVVTAAQKAHMSYYGYTAVSCPTCTAHINSWKVSKMEAEIQQMKRLSSFL